MSQIQQNVTDLRQGARAYKTKNPNEDTRSQTLRTDEESQKVDETKNDITSQNSKLNNDINETPLYSQEIPFLEYCQHLNKYSHMILKKDKLILLQFLVRTCLFFRNEIKSDILSILDIQAYIMKSAGHLSVDQEDFCFLVYKHYLSTADWAFFWKQLRIFTGKA